MTSDIKGIGSGWDLFGVLAPWYERLIAPPDVDRLRALLQRGPGESLLDVGGGTGRATQYLADGDGLVCVLDVSTGMLQQAAGKAHLEPCLALAERLPFAAGAFDRVLLVDSFHHFRGHARSARELARVLAPGGRIVIEEPDVRRLVVKVVALGEKLALMRSHFYPPAELLRFFALPGLRATLHEDGGPNFWAVIEK